MAEPEQVELHPECKKMHAAGYCVCNMVSCYGCEVAHPPHKPCGPPARDLLKIYEARGKKAE